jgi:erythromycin esterase-like protein
MRLRTRATALLLIALLAGGGRAHATGAIDEQVLQRIAHDVCDKELVLIGEDPGHGGGGTLEVKRLVVESLIRRCGFSTLYFESPVYEFLALEEDVSRGTATRAQLEDAVGALWSGAKEFEPVLDFLWPMARDGTLRLAGMDLQVGGITQHYTQQALPTRLARHLERTRRDECSTQLTRLTNWEFSETSPYDDTARQALKKCIADILEATASLPEGPERWGDAQMAVNLARYVELSSQDFFNGRDHAMYQNLMWHQARFPDRKAIVWSANTHVIKQPPPSPAGRQPLGTLVHSEYGRRMASLAFTAASGTHGRAGAPPQQIPNPLPDSVEMLSSSARSAAHYLDRRALKRHGVAPSFILGYRTPQSADWGALIDGLIIVQEEHPVNATLPRTPSGE